MYTLGPNYAAIRIVARGHADSRGAEVTSLYLESLRGLSEMSREVGRQP